MKKLLLPVVMAVFAAGCMSASDTIPVQSLEKGFVLVEFDGVPITDSPQKPLNIGFEAGSAENEIRIHANVCNHIMGKGMLTEGYLQSGEMMMSRMTCSADLNSMESAFLKMLSEKTRMRLKGETLILSGNGHTFVYREMKP